MPTAPRRSGAGGFPDDEFGINHDFQVRGLLLRIARKQAAANDMTDSVPGNMDRGEGRLAELRQLHIIEPSHRHILRHAQTPFPEFP